MAEPVMEGPTRPPTVGQTWEEVDPRITPPRRVLIQHISNERVAITSDRTTRVTWAKLSRFHGKRGGYRYIGG
jgi:hypothetical protein